MRINKLCGLVAFTPAVLAAHAAFAGLTVGAPIDVIGNLPVASFIANGYGTNTYKDWGNEPSIAVNPLNTSQIVISSFSYGTSSTTSGANLFYSTTGGTNWTSQFSVPAPATGVRIPNDWKFAYDASGTLHGVVLGGCSTCNIYQGSTNDPTSLAAWSYTGGGTRINNAASAGKADQPWIAIGGGKIFAAYDDFHAGTGERVTVSSNGGTSFPVDNPINNGAQANSVNPGTRIAADAAGKVYSIFGVGGPPSPAGVHTVDYYLNRSGDGGVTWDFNGSSGVGGILITSGKSSQLDNAGTQASNNWFAHVNDLRGNITAIATDKTGTHVYVLVGKQDGTGTDRIYLDSYLAVGVNLVKTSEIVVSPAFERAALPSLTVKDDGSVVILYETADANNKVHVHIAASDDFGATIATDIEEYSFNPRTLLQATGSTTSNREFGDYNFITSVGNTFFGTFAGLGNVNAGGIDTTGLIDPFFFSGSDVTVAEPGSLALLLVGLSGFVFLRRSRT